MGCSSLLLRTASGFGERHGGSPKIGTGCTFRLPRQSHSSRAFVTTRENVDSIAVHTEGRRGGRIRSAAQTLCHQQQRVGVVRIEVGNGGRGIGHDGVRCSRSPLVVGHPRHTAVPADEPNGLDLDTPQMEIAEIDVIRGM